MSAKKENKNTMKTRCKPKKVKKTPVSSKAAAASITTTRVLLNLFPLQLSAFLQSNSAAWVRTEKVSSNLVYS